MNMQAAIQKTKNAVPLAAFVVVLYVILGLGVYFALTSHVLGGNDFFSRWEGARALLLRGDNPYSDSVTREIQIQMNGRLSLPSEDQLAFAYPLYVIFPLAPFVTSPYALALAFWMALLILGLFGGSMALFRLYHVSLGPMRLALTLVGVLVFYPSVRGIFNGQVALLSIGLLIFGLLAIDAQADVAGGALLALATFKPQPPILILPIVLVWAWRHGRTTIVTSTVITLSGLVLLGLILIPTWPLDFLQGLRNYAQYEPVGPPVQILSGLLFGGDLGLAFTVGISLLLLGGLVWQAARSLDDSWAGYQTTIGLGAIVTTLMAGRMGTPDQVLLLIPWTMWLSRLGHGENLEAIAGGLALLVLPWLAFLTTLRGNAENPAVALVLPFLSLAAYLWQARTMDRLMPERVR